MDKLDKLIKEAICKYCEELYAEIPSKEELENEYTFSERHNTKMQELFQSLGLKIDNISPE